MKKKVNKEKNKEKKVHVHVLVLLICQTVNNHKCPALATRSLLSFFILNSTLLWGVEVWNNPSFLSHPKFHTSQKCRSVETSDKVRIMSHVFPGHETSVILYLVPHFLEVWKCGKVWQGKAGDNVKLFPLSWYLCHSLLSSRDYKGDREGIPHIHPIP